jgi:uncharacterized membrane protein YbaN (DUF454 family)
MNITSKAVYFLIGCLCMILAGFGVALPLVPATPFVLLAAACFAKSSPRFHQYLLNHQVTGPIVKDWEQRRCIQKRYKILAIGSMLVFGGISVGIIIKPLWLKALGAALMALGAWYVSSIKTCCEDCDESVKKSLEDSSDER